MRSVTARRQLRWIVWGTALGAVPFVFGYALPFALGSAAGAGRSSSARVLLGLVPLAFASAIVRYRLMDVEVIIKRALVYAAALAAIAAIYAVLLWLVERGLLRRRSDPANPIIALLATLVVVLLGAAGEERDSDRRSTASTTAIATTTAARWSASRAI